MPLSLLRTSFLSPRRCEYSLTEFPSLRSWHSALQMSEEELQELVETVAEGPRRPVRGRLQVAAGADAERPCAEGSDQAERETFRLKRELGRLDIEDPEPAQGRESLPEVRRGK